MVEGLDADRLFTRLEENLASLAEIAERRHPLTPALAVATAKRWLAEPDKNRIRLHDMVMDEVERVCAACAPEHFPVQGIVPSAEEFLKRLKRYETATETLCALTTTFVQWGDDSHRTLWTKVVEHLDSQAVVQSSYSAWKDLQRYPTLLVLYSGGVGAVAAGRYDWMKALLADPIRRENEKAHPVGRRLDATSHLGKYLADATGNKGSLTPGSDRLYVYLKSLFQTSKAFSGRFQESFDRFEFLFLLWRALTDASVFYGCFAWRQDYDLPIEIAEEAWRADTEWPPLKQGFFHESAATIREKCERLAASINKLGWRW